MRVSRRVLALVILGGAVVFLAGLLQVRKDPAPERGLPLSSFSFDPDEVRSHWSERIEAVGGAAAWRELKNAYANANFGVQHTAAHVFGEALYAESNLEGIAVCDAVFAYGCYHSFFGGAFAEHGVGIAGRLLELCRARFGSGTIGCEHGIGHGLMEFLGAERLDEALRACPKDTRPYYGCAAGVFMEYNAPVRFEEGLSSATVREYDPGKPYAPCTEVLPEFREACYHELPGWWLVGRNADRAAVQALCEGLSDPLFRKACLAGIPAHL